MLKAIRQDLQAVFDRDPAATSRLEVILTYAGFHALLIYRIAHWLKIHGVPLCCEKLKLPNPEGTGVPL